MQAILYVGHGTRLRKGIEEARQFIEETKPAVTAVIQEIAFLELADPDIVAGAAKCVAQGATKISVIPILLLTAQHAKEDIPAEVEKAKRLFPHVLFTIARPFGIHSALIETVYERITEQRRAIHPAAEVVLIGRGSSDEAVVKDMAVISQQLQQRYHFKKVQSCFLYGAGPSFEHMLETFKHTRSAQVFFVPYLLFSGLLSNGIEKKISGHAFNPETIILCKSLGYNEKVRTVLLERVRETT